MTLAGLESHVLNKNRLWILHISRPGRVTIDGFSVPFRQFAPCSEPHNFVEIVQQHRCAITAERTPNGIQGSFVQFLDLPRCLKPLREVDESCQLPHPICQGRLELLAFANITTRT